VLEFLNQNIPITRVLGVQVESAGTGEAILSAPLEANVNHYDTVFGGSASSLAILAAWTVIHVRLQECEAKTRLIIQKSTMEYQKPITADFTAIGRLSDVTKWPVFVKTLDRRGRARISANSILLCQGTQVARFQGDFVAFKLDD
jgi:thioesterase domain-containing protein